MSTRANIIITDGWDELIFYRHSDGYPAGTLPSLNQFLNLIRTVILTNQDRFHSLARLGLIAWGFRRPQGCQFGFSSIWVSGQQTVQFRASMAFSM